MQGPIERYLLPGIIAAAAYPDFTGSPLKAVRAIAADPYFHVIELNPVAGADRKAVAGMAAQAHLTVCYGAQARLLTAGLNPNDPDEAGRQKAEQTLLEGIDEAAALGAGRMAFLAGKWAPETKAQDLCQLHKTTRTLCRYAKSRGIFIELEIFDFDIDKAALIGPASLAARFAAGIRSEYNNFGLLADLSHFPMCREDSTYIIRLLRPYLTHFHIGNTVIKNAGADAYGDLHPRFGYPGSENDTEQLKMFLQVLKSEGFFCKEVPYILSFEVAPRPQEDIRTVIANSKRTLNRAWAML